MLTNVCLVFNMYFYQTAFEEDNLTQSGQDSSYGDESSQQEQDPLAIEPKVRHNFLFFVSLVC